MTPLVELCSLIEPVEKVVIFVRLLSAMVLVRIPDASADPHPILRSWVDLLHPN